MFWKRIMELCYEHKTSPAAVCAELGLSNATATHWKKGAIPRETTLQKLAVRFGVTVEYLLGKEEETPVNTAKSFIGEFLSEDEQRIILTYRTNETFREAVNNIYLLTAKETEPQKTVRVYRAARSSDHHGPEVVEMDADRLERLNNLPDTDDPL